MHHRCCAYSKNCTSSAKCSVDPCYIINVQSDRRRQYTLYSIMYSTAHLQAQEDGVLALAIHFCSQQEVGAAVLQRAAEGALPAQRQHKVCATLLCAAGDKFHTRRLLREGHAAERISIRLLSDCLQLRGLTRSRRRRASAGGRRGRSQLSASTETVTRCSAHPFVHFMRKASSGEDTLRGHTCQGILMGRRGEMPGILAYSARCKLTDLMRDWWWSVAHVSLAAHVLATCLTSTMGPLSNMKQIRS